MGVMRPGRPTVRLPRPQVTPPRVRRPLSTGPLWLLVGAVLVLGLLLLGRLGQMQVVRGPELAAAAEQVSTRVLPEPALRGRILAEDGTPLVTNEPTSVVTVEPRVLLEEPDGGRALVESVARALDLPADQLWGRTLLCGTADAPPAPACFSGSPYQPVPVAYDVDPVAALALLERPEEHPGVAIDTHPVRAYPAPAGVNAAHALGYLGRPTQAEVEASAGAVGAQDRVGRAGLEQTYDQRLRGTPGRTRVSVDPRGVVTGHLDSSDPVPGADLVTHLDVRVQAAAEQAVQQAVDRARADGRPARSAAALVLRPDSGAVVASASLPTYAPDVWTRGVSQQEYQDLLDPELGQPLLDRSVAQTFAPASTFKVVSLAAALQNGIDPAADYPCPGAVTIAGQRFTNYESQAYGALDLTEVMGLSCDTTFYRWAHDAWLDQGGMAQTSDEQDRFVQVARGFGLGRPTGIDLPGEVAGLVPSRQWKREYWEATRDTTCQRAQGGYPEVKDAELRDYLEQLARENCADGWQWRPGDAVNFSIGQGDVAATPAQVAVLYAAIANGGRLWAPRVAARWQSQDGTVLEQVRPEQVGGVSLDPQHLAVVRGGLEAVNVAGTGSGAFAGWPHQDYPLAGKTGSAEAVGREATAWYASYGPVPDPEFVVVVMVEEGGLGASAAAPAARAIWEVLADR